MRIFWIILGLVVALAAATLVMSREPAAMQTRVERPSEPAEALGAPALPPPTALATDPAPEADPQPEPEDTELLPEPESDVASISTIEPGVAAPEPVTGDETASNASPPTPGSTLPAKPVAPMTDSSDPAKALIADLLASIDQREAGTMEPAPTPAPVEGDTSGGEFEIDLNPPPPIRRPPTAMTESVVGSPNDDQAPNASPTADTEPDKDKGEGEGAVEIVEQDDGSKLLDDRYIIKGSGTPDDPYRITWDLLVSASKSYQPRQGKEEIPQRIELLNGAHVKLTGYLTFPLAGQTAKEGLLMLNQWDGCCIGVPPSPYDAIELVLAEPMPLKRGRFVPYGTVEGKLIVDPYLVNNWLVGLYIMKEARLEMGF